MVALADYTARSTRSANYRCVGVVVNNTTQHETGRELREIMLAVDKPSA
jgi:hypothetical protein